MKRVYILFILCFLLISAKAEISDVLLTENQYKALAAINTIHTADTGQLNSIWKNDTTLVRIYFDDFIRTTQILHMNPDTTYINNKDTYTVCKQLTENYLNETKDIIQGFQSYTDKENNKFYKQNIQSYFATQLFQLFYQKSSQYVLLQSNVQDALKPKIIGDMLMKSIDETRLRNDLIFIAKNSKFNLYNY